MSAKPAAAAAPAATPAPAAGAAAPAAKDAKKSTLKKKKGTGVKRAQLKFTIDCSEPAADEIFDIAAFEKFLHDRFKVAGKAGVLGDLVTITRDNNTITVNGKIAFSKRYLKYLAKKFLKKQLLRDYIRVIAKTKNSYFLKYYNFHADEEQAEENDS